MGQGASISVILRTFDRNEQLCEALESLANQTSDGILLRHVLEHNPGWRRILSGAVESFTKKMVLVIYTPFGDVTRNIRKQIPWDTRVPVAISFRKEDITSCIPPQVSWFTLVGPPLDEFETMFFLKKGVEPEVRGVLSQEVNYCPNFDGSL
jgi:hypothetical protein